MEKADLRFTWILEEKEKKTPDQELEIERQYRRMWFFENGRVVLTTDEDWQELVVTVNTITEGPELQVWQCPFFLACQHSLKPFYFKMRGFQLTNFGSFSF